MGDVREDGAKEVIYVGVDHKLHILSVDASAASLTFSPLHQINDRDIAPLGEENLKAASFFDFDDTGNHGILLETVNNELRGYMYLNDESSYFLKALGYDGTGEGQTRVGVSYQYLMTDVGGNEILRAGHQTIANAHRALQLPFMLDGLGRCQNYIEYLSFGHYKSVARLNN